MTPPVDFHSFPLPVTHVLFFAVLLWNQGGITAEPRRCHSEHGDPIELLLRFDGGDTAIIGGRTAGSVRCHCRAGGATALALRQKGGSTTSANVVFGRTTVFAAAEDVATVITVISVITVITVIT